MIDIQKLRMLIVDDEKEVREGLATFLAKQFSAEVVTAVNGYEALEQIRWHSFDVICLDIGMPGVSGREVLLEIREHLPKAVVLVMTRWDSEVIAQEIASTGAEYVPKPYVLNQVKALLDKKLAERLA